METSDKRPDFNPPPHLENRYSEAAAQKKRWDKLNAAQKRYAEDMGTTMETLTDRQYQILVKERPEIWPNYQWHFGSSEWNRPVKREDGK